MYRRFLLIILFLTSGLFAQQFKIAHYTSRENLPTNTYFDAFQTKEGELLFASEIGLISYDTDKFSLVSGITQSNYPIRNLYEDPRGGFWIMPFYSYDTIYYCINKDSVLHVRPVHYSKKQLKRLRGMAFLKTDHGRIIPHILLDHRSIYSLNKETWKPVVQISDNLLVRDLISSGTKLFAVTSEGLYVYRDSAFTPLNKINELLPSRELLAAFIEKDSTDTETIWLFTRDWLGFVRNGKFSLATTNIDIIHYKIGTGEYFIHKSGQNVFFGSQNTLLIYNLENQKITKVVNDELNDILGVTSINEDYEKNIWVTSYRGVYKLSQTAFTSYTSLSGLQYDEITAIEPISKSNIALGQEGNLVIFNALNHVNKNIEIKLKLSSTATFSRIWDLYRDNDDTLWIIDYSNGLGRLQGGKIQWVKSVDTENFSSITQDSENNYWLSSYSRLYLFKNNKLIPHPLPEQSSPRKIFPRKEGGIYIVTTHAGLLTYNSDKETNRYLSSNFDGNSVYAVAEDNVLGVLVGTRNGLYGIDSDSLKKVDDKRIQIDLPIYSIESNDSGLVWFGTNRGVFKYEDNNLRHYGIEDGLAGLECNRDAAYLDESGKFWVGTDGGLSIYDSQYDNNETIKPKGQIDYLSTSDGTRYSVQDKIIIPYQNRSIFIKLSAFSYIEEKRNRFLIALKLEDGTIIDEFITSKSEIRLPSLAPGNYRFEMRVENGKGIKSDSLYIASFSINSPFYLQNWFYLLIVLITASITSVIYKYNFQKKQSKILENTVTLRTRELEEKINEKNIIENALRVSELRYKNLFQNSAFGIYQSTLDGKLILYNPAFQKMMGAKDLEELKNMDVEKNFYTDERNSFIKNIMSHGNVIGLEKKYRTLDNRIIWVRESARIIKDQNEQTLIEGAIEDITATKNAEREMLKALKKAENSDRLKSEFLAQMSHEIRTPVNTILSFSSLIKDELNGNENRNIEEYFSAITRGSERLIRTIDSILNLSQLQLGNYEAKYESLDLREIVSGIIEEFKYPAREKGLELRTIEHDKPVIINADSYSVSQILANLIDNSIKYTEKGEVTIRIEMSSNNLVQLVVEDTGVGMTKEYQEKVFEPFSQEETGYSRRYEGTGLGLSLVQKYCVINSALIEVESTKGKGSKFTITFTR